jgi:hypothetical protein
MTIDLFPLTLLKPGRPRAVMPARAMLVYLAHERSPLTMCALSRRPQRDPTMISHLATTYEAQRDTKVETQ